MKEIIEVLNEVKSGVDYQNEKHLISGGIITSFDLVMLISLLNDKFDIEITVVDVVPENFESVDTIKALIDRLK